MEGRSRHYCGICDLDCHFASKLQKHLRTRRHLLYAEVVQFRRQYECHSVNASGRYLEEEIPELPQGRECPYEVATYY